MLLVLINICHMVTLGPSIPASHLSQPRHLMYFCIMSHAFSGSSLSWTYRRRLGRLRCSSSTLLISVLSEMDISSQRSMKLVLSHNSTCVMGPLVFQPRGRATHIGFALHPSQGPAEFSEIYHPTAPTSSTSEEASQYRQ